MEKIPFNLKEGFNGNLGWILAGGSAFKGEDKFTCIKKELFEETGIISENFKELEILFPMMITAFFILSHVLQIGIKPL